MGIGALLKGYVTGGKKAATTPEKGKKGTQTSTSPHTTQYLELQPPTPMFDGHSRPSTSAGSTRSSTVLDDIKHEVMVNYLYQQQCSHMWVGDLGPELEGVLLRKSRNAYMACPPELGDSPFATACAALNVQVRILNV